MEIAIYHKMRMLKELLHKVSKLEPHVEKCLECGGCIKLISRPSKDCSVRCLREWEHTYFSQFGC